MQLPTVKIKHATREFLIINESEFDESKHELYDENAQAAEPVIEPVAEKPRRGRKPKAEQAAE